MADKKLTAKRKSPAKVAKRPDGRPTSYKQAVAKEILDRMGDGQSLYEICKDDDMPTKQTVYNWKRAHPEFFDLFAHAQVEQMKAWASDTIGLIDSAEADWTVTVNLDDPDVVRQVDEAGKVTFKFKRPHLERAKAMVSARQWLMERIAADDFSTKQKVDVNHRYTQMDDDELFGEMKEAVEAVGIPADQLVALLQEHGVQH